MGVSLRSVSQEDDSQSSPSPHYFSESLHIYGIPLSSISVARECSNARIQLKDYEMAIIRSQSLKTGMPAIAWNIFNLHTQERSTVRNNFINELPPGELLRPRPFVSKGNPRVVTVGHDFCCAIHDTKNQLAVLVEDRD
jgi:hypothetical protein